MNPVGDSVMMSDCLCCAAEHKSCRGQPSSEMLQLGEVSKDLRQVI